MTEYSRKAENGAWRRFKQLIPLLIVAGTGLMAYGGLRERVIQHDQLLTEMRGDIKQLLRGQNETMSWLRGRNSR